MTAIAMPRGMRPIARPQPEGADAATQARAPERAQLRGARVGDAHVAHACLHGRGADERGDSAHRRCRCIFRDRRCIQSSTNTG